MIDRPRRGPKKGAPDWEEGDLLSLRVPASAAQAFRVEAARRRLSQKTFFLEIWRLYQETHNVGI